MCKRSLISFSYVIRYVGKLVGRYYDSKGNPTKYLKGVEAKAARGAQLLEKQKKEEAKQPSCNSRWSQDEGGEVFQVVWLQMSSSTTSRSWHRISFFVSWQMRTCHHPCNTHGHFNPLKRARLRVHHIWWSECCSVFLFILSSLFVRFGVTLASQDWYRDLKKLLWRGRWASVAPALQRTSWAIQGWKYIKDVTPLLRPAVSELGWAVHNRCFSFECKHWACNVHDAI